MSDSTTSVVLKEAQDAAYHAFVESDPPYTNAAADAAIYSLLGNLEGTAVDYVDSDDQHEMFVPLSQIKALQDALA